MIYTFLEKNYYVRPLSEEDLNGPYPTWFQDQEITRYNSHGKFFKTKDYFLDYYKKANNEDRLVWAICHSKDGHIGNISLQGISFINRNAEFAIIMGDKKHWGKGVALAASKCILTHGFQKLNLEKIYCGTASSNEGMKKLALGLGMKEEGCRRKHLYLEGAWQDALEYGVLKSEFSMNKESND